MNCGTYIDSYCRDGERWARTVTLYGYRCEHKKYGPWVLMSYC